MPFLAAPSILSKVGEAWGLWIIIAFSPYFIRPIPCT
jgi:hypothetical protein